MVYEVLLFKNTILKLKNKYLKKKMILNQRYTTLNVKEFSFIESKIKNLKKNIPEYITKI